MACWGAPKRISNSFAAAIVEVLLASPPVMITDNARKSKLGILSLITKAFVAAARKKLGQKVYPIWYLLRSSKNLAGSVATSLVPRWIWLEAEYNALRCISQKFAEWSNAAQVSQGLKRARGKLTYRSKRGSLYRCRWDEWLLSF